MFDYYDGFMKFNRKMKELDYFFDRQVTITHEDGEFIETRDVISGGNRKAVILKVPLGNIVLVCLGGEFGYRYSLLGCNRDNIINVFKYDIFPQEIWKGYCFEATFFPANIHLKGGQSIIWEIKEPSLNIKRDTISYCGLWDIYVHKNEKQKFSWWKDDKYVPPSKRLK